MSILTCAGTVRSYCFHSPVKRRQVLCVAVVAVPSCLTLSTRHLRVFDITVVLPLWATVQHMVKVKMLLPHPSMTVIKQLIVP